MHRENGILKVAGVIFTTEPTECQLDYLVLNVAYPFSGNLKHFCCSWATVTTNAKWSKKYWSLEDKGGLATLSKCLMFMRVYFIRYPHCLNGGSFFQYTTFPIAKVKDNWCGTYEESEGNSMSHEARKRHYAGQDTLRKPTNSMARKSFHWNKQCNRIIGRPKNIQR